MTFILTLPTNQKRKYGNGDKAVASRCFRFKDWLKRNKIYRKDLVYIEYANQFENNGSQS
jgi:hypothetical protein